MLECFSGIKEAEKYRLQGKIITRYMQRTEKHSDEQSSHYFRL